MSRKIHTLSFIALAGTLLSAAHAAEPGFVGVETFLPPPQSSLQSGKSKSNITSPSPVVMPDLHLSTALKTSTTAATMPNFAGGQIVWSSRATPTSTTTGSRPASPSAGDSLLGINQRADASPFLLTGAGSQPVLPSASGIVTPSLLHDTGASLASPSLYMPPSNYLENSHPSLGH